MYNNSPAPRLQGPNAAPENNFPFSDEQYAVIIANLEPIGSKPNDNEEVGEIVAAPKRSCMTLEPIDRARKYLLSVPPAVSGQGGHRQTFAAALALTQGFCLEYATSLALLSEWNCRCSPPWSECELAHKITDASKAQSNKPRGWLFNELSPTYAPIPKPITIPATVKRRPVEWPIMRDGFICEIAAVARMRGLGLDGITKAQTDGLLRFGSWQGYLAWFVTDPGAPFRIAQARRMDGQPWEQLTGKPKAWTICEAGMDRAKWPVGISLASGKSSIALCEGGPDLLAAYHFCTVEQADAVCQPVCQLGAGMEIHSEALPLFAGKHVRIFPDADSAGNKAARKWARQLKDNGATVDWYNYSGCTTADGQPVKDLNDLARMSADRFETHKKLEIIMPRGGNHGN
jgi:hypothetical protein